MYSLKVKIIFNINLSQSVLPPGNPFRPVGFKKNRYGKGILEKHSTLRQPISGIHIRQNPKTSKDGGQQWRTMSEKGCYRYPEHKCSRFCSVFVFSMRVRCTKNWFIGWWLRPLSPTRRINHSLGIRMESSPIIISPTSFGAPDLVYIPPVERSLRR